MSKILSPLWTIHPSMRLVLDLAWFSIDETCHIRTFISPLDDELVGLALSLLNVTCLTLDQCGVDLTLLSFVVLVLSTFFVVRMWTPRVLLLHIYLGRDHLVDTLVNLNVDSLSTSSTHPP